MCAAQWMYLFVMGIVSINQIIGDDSMRVKIVYTGLAGGGGRCDGRCVVMMTMMMTAVLCVR